MSGKNSSSSQTTEYLRKMERVARRGNYHLNPDEEHTLDLVESLLVNESRYGYPSCPCRLAEGEREKDRDIICPCDYRDADLAEFGTCYCALYVSEKIAGGGGEAMPIPERRPSPEERKRKGAEEKEPGGNRGREERVKGSPAYPVWRCRVCGYLCGRDEPPDKCPICGADRDRFERFL